ncbi:hypothetical protein ACHZ97_04315 [Lysobacter soli]|uniref:hypothetical protein n=1 Tax=Lysobacter soli TaxID=453783 RepID=UPI0037C789BD
MAAQIIGYEVRYRPALSNQAWKVESFGPGSTTLSLKGLTRGTSYEGEARSIGPNGLASAWVPVTFTVAGASLVPLAPTGLSATTVADGVALKWTVADQQRTDVEYRIDRAPDSGGVPGAWAELTRVRALHYTDPVTDQVRRWYRVRAVSFAGIESTISGIVDRFGKASVVIDSETPPQNPSPGTTWFQPSSKLMRYWNGTGWSLLADQAETASDAFVLNADMNAGDVHWGKEPGWRWEDNGTDKQFVHDGSTVAGGSSPNAALINAKRVRVIEGQTVKAIGFVRSAGAANGNAMIGVYCYNAAGGFANLLTGNPVVGTGSPQRSIANVKIPAGVAEVALCFYVTGHTTGYWVADNGRMSFTVDTVDEVADGATYAKVRSSGLNGGVVTGLNHGRNMLANPNFSFNNEQVLATDIRKAPGASLMDDWYVESSSLGGPWISNPGFGRGGNGHAMVVAADGASLAAGASNVFDQFRSRSKIAASAGQRVYIEAWGRQEYSTGVPAGVGGSIVLTARCFDVNGNITGSAADIVLGLREAGMGGAYAKRASVGTVPANTAYINVVGYLTLSNGNGFPVSVSGSILHGWDDIVLAFITSMDNEIDHGTTYGKTANVDLYDEGAIRRVGLRVKGSRQILGGARNSRASLVYGVSAVRTTTALSATSAGVVSVNAHNVEVSGETVTYAAVANAVSGLTPGTTYVIFTLDPFLDGGTRTYYAQTNILSAQQTGEGAVLIGNITIPTSGGSTGGGGGGGNPGDWCVEADALLPDGRRACEVVAGDWIACWDFNGADPQLKYVQVESNTIVPDQPSTTITTHTGGRVTASNSTPMTLRDGRTVGITAMAGEDALEMRLTTLGRVLLRFGLRALLNCLLRRKALRALATTLRWCPVVTVASAGRRTVAKIKVHQHCYFAGVTADVTIATHNPTYKP